MSPVRQPASSCGFNPSCSQYAKEAIVEFGPFVGSLLAADRLMRCGGHTSISAYPFDGKRSTDPASKNYLLGTANLWRLGRTNISTNQDSVDIVPHSFRFPYTLFCEQEYDYSIIELKRLQLNSEISEDKVYAPVLIAINQLSNKSIKKARLSIDGVERLQLSPIHSQNTFLIDYLIADAENLDGWNASRCKDELKNSAIFPPKILLQMQVYSLTKAEKYDNAKILVSDYPIRQDAINGVENSSHKSALLAGIMSTILPGSGYVYTGRLGEGLSALAFNALLGWGIYSLFKNHNTGSAILLSSITVPFYVGNIVGSANAALSENAKSRELALGTLRHALELDFYFSIDFLKQCWK